MRQGKLFRAGAAGFLLAWGGFGAGTAVAQAPAEAPTEAAQQSVAGGRLHGVVKSGQTPLPGVAVTAQNTLTGKRYATTTDITGAWSLTLSQNGRYVVRTQFAAFATGVQEAVLNAASHDQTVDFSLLLASRVVVAPQTGEEAGALAQSPRQMAARGAQNLSLVSSLSADVETQAGSSQAAGGELPTVAASSDFSSESVAISGQSGQVSAAAGQDMDRLRDQMETMRAQGGGQAGGLFGGGGAGGFGGGGGMGGGFGGGFGGPGGPGGRGNFRGFNSAQPHGAVFWIGSNSALNAQPYNLRDSSETQPASGSNRFGVSFMSAPYIPGLTKPSGKDTFFLTLSGQRSSSPVNEYALVPTDAERGGDFSASGLPLIYNPATYAQFSSNGTANVIPSGNISSQATALLKYFPEPNLTGNSSYNYRLLSTAQTNSTQYGARYMRSLGKNASLPSGGGRGFGSNRRSQNQGLRQSINFNYNGARSAADNVNIFPDLGGKTNSESNALSVGYTLGYRKLTNILTLSWNRNHSQVINFFTNHEDIATELGIMGDSSAALNQSALNYGLPNITLSSITGLTEQQPSEQTQQTISASETLSWIHGKHNLRFGGDYRRVHNDVLGGSNATGTFTFTGLFTENSSGSSSTGSALADFLLGLPQTTSIDSSAAKSYLRDNVFDGFAMDDWRLSRSFTVNAGLRWEYFQPYGEKDGYLAMVDTNASGGFTRVTEVQAGGTGASSGKLPEGLVYGNHHAFSPRVGLAWRVPKLPQTVIRAGYGMNYMVGQYGTFASSMAHEPMVNNANFVNEQTNREETTSGTASTACARATTSTCFTLANGFSLPDTVGNYAVDPHYNLPYLQAWNVNVQKTLPWNLVMNVGYNGTRGSSLDIKSAPWESASSPNTNPNDVSFTYEQGAATSRFNAGTLSVQKRLSGGLALGAFYKYSHSIDNAASVAQNWQALNAEEGNSSNDVRHSVNGNYLYELPFGSDREWVTTGLLSHILEGFSLSGTFTFATGTPLTPTYQASVSEAARGSSGTFRPDRVAGQSITAGGGSVKKWFNTAAFTAPANTYGTASRYSIPGPGTVSNNMTLSKTMRLGDMRSWEFRATSNNVFNTVQYSGVDTNVSSATFGQVSSTGTMRTFQFESRFRF
jgi:hypothetical protein